MLEERRDNHGEYIRLVKQNQVCYYGREVRTALHDSIDAVNQETESNTESCKNLRNDLTAHSNTKATGGVLGHVTLSDSVSDTFNNSESVAATPHAVKLHTTKRLTHVRQQTLIERH